MIRKKKHKEENIYIRAILFIVPTMAIMILLILFIINAWLFIVRKWIYGAIYFS